MTDAQLRDMFIRFNIGGAQLAPMEQEAIKTTIEAGRRYGYGNMMAWLATAWATHLRDSGLSEKIAIEAVSNRGPYPLPKPNP